MPQLSHSELDNKTKLLRATFLHNLAFFQKKMPELYEYYRDYTPSKVTLTFDHNGDVNLVNDGSLIYQENPQESSAQQVAAYIDKPRQFVSQLSFSENLKYQHEKELKKLYEKREQLLSSKQVDGLLKNGEFIDFMAMIGLGIGYQCQQLFEKINIRHLFIWEPDSDIFYCSMHIIDFKNIFESCIDNAGALIIKVGGNENQFVNEIDQQLKNYGYFNSARLYMYRHYRSEETDKGYKNLTDLCYRLSNGWGFCEDEIISISHTLTAVEKKLPLLKSPTLFKNIVDDVPVFIIGNGPSLDEHLAYLKGNQKNAVVFSCGTALKAILDAGIMPDFHIEMERVAATYEWIDKVGHKDKLKQISIITLNTVYSEIQNLFGQAYIIGKPKDGGMDFLYEFISEEEFPGVYACNPTVTNASAAIAIRLGFKQLFLFGVDFGYKDEQKHHAKGSMYYQKDFHGFTEKMTSAFKIKGNFGEDVFTTQTFDVARASMELLLQENPDVVCCNCSDGARIQLTTSQKIDEIGTLHPINEKNKVLASLLLDAFSNKAYGELDFNRIFQGKLKAFKKIIDELKGSCKGEVPDRGHLAYLFSEQYKYLKQLQGNKETEVYYRFINGTLNYFQSNIMTNVFYFSQSEDRKKYINWALSIFSEHLSWLYQELVEQYDQASKH